LKSTDIKSSEIDYSIKIDNLVKSKYFHTFKSLDD
jgi:hypothetical protein